VTRDHASQPYIKPPMFNFYLRVRQSQVLVAHGCNPSYLEGRDQEDCSSKPAPGK
jgi:hypothetical protein